MAKKVLRPDQMQAIALMVGKDYNGLTIGEIAKQVGVSRGTIYEWKKNDAFTEELVKQAEAMQRAYIAETYAELRGIIGNKAVADNNRIKAIEVYLKNQGRLKDVQEQTITVEERSLDDMLAELED